MSELKMPIVPNSRPIQPSESRQIDSSSNNNSDMKLDNVLKDAAQNKNTVRSRRLRSIVYGKMGNISVNRAPVVLQQQTKLEILCSQIKHFYLDYRDE